VSEKRRADVLLLERGLAPTRSQAQALILAGKVYAGERRVEKAGTLLAADVAIRVAGEPRFVSRGGLKLDSALETLHVSVEGLCCADVGASTGGFTDCLLQRGARRVYAIDVGYGQLAPRLAGDPRVVVMDRTNARYLTADSLGEHVDLVVVDASFISLRTLLPALGALLREGGRLLALVKPQFEAGREQARRGRGVIKDPEIREHTIAAVRQAVESHDFVLHGECDSTVAGPKGNVEHFVLAEKRARAQKTSTQTS
jgi:23S rRNA (cytidine1920-2'-O)/16S rRNA (cytidine1409-2'-O)-methyltransferase